jgi:hypothetical protein
LKIRRKGKKIDSLEDSRETLMRSWVSVLVLLEKSEESLRSRVLVFIDS